MYYQNEITMKYAINTENGYMRDIFGLVAKFNTIEGASDYALAHHDIGYGTKTYEITSSHGDVVRKFTLN